MIYLSHNRINLRLIQEKWNNDQSVHTVIACKHYVIIMFAHQLSGVKRKPVFCIYAKNRGADKLHRNDG